MSFWRIVIGLVWLYVHPILWLFWWYYCVKNPRMAT